MSSKLSSHKGAKKAKKHILVATLNIMAHFNNTIVSLCDQQGGVICWSSAGKLKYRGAKKSTPYVAQKVVEDVFDVRKNPDVARIRSVFVSVKGIGSGREGALRALMSIVGDSSSGEKSQNKGIVITTISDSTPVPHNGVRAPKRRRV